MRNNAHCVARAVIDGNVAAALGFLQIDRLLVDPLAELDWPREASRQLIASQRVLRSGDDNIPPKHNGAAI